MDTRNSIIMYCLWFGGCLIGGLLAYWKSKNTNNNNNVLEPEPEKNNEATDKFLQEHPLFLLSMHELLSDFPGGKFQLIITPKEPEK